MARIPQDPEQVARASLRRSAIIYAVILAIDVLFVYLLVANGASGGGYVTLSIVSLVGLLIAFGYDLLFSKFLLFADAQLGATHRQ